MMLKTQKRAYLRGLPSLPVGRQRELAVTAGCDVVYEWGEAGRKANSRDRWLGSLRDGDVAWLPDIRVLVLPKPPRVGRPTSDLGAAIAAVLATGAIIVDARVGITSKDRKTWANHVEWALAHAAQGERNQRRQRASLKNARSKRGIATKWMSAEMTAERERYRDVWCSARYPTDEATKAGMPDELKSVSVATLRRIFGPRFPGDLSAGGRGRKKKR